MIKASIFDLDNCIFDNFSISDETLRPLHLTLDREIQAGNIPEALRQTIRKEIRVHSPKYLGEKYDLSFSSVLAVCNAIADVVIEQPLFTYGDHEVIGALPGLKVLVTAGSQIEKYQNQKIDKLGIRHFFHEVHISGNKTPVFQGILNSLGLLGSEVLVIGDNPHSELAAGRELGMITVQTLRPRVKKAEDVDHYVETFYQLPDIIKLYEQT